MESVAIRAARLPPPKASWIRLMTSDTKGEKGDTGGTEKGRHPWTKGKIP